MYFYIETLKQRLDAINQLRVDRALGAMKPAFQQVYSLLPILLHHHHPLMPGYLEGKVPHGICTHTPDEKQQQYLDGIALRWGQFDCSHPQGELPITGIYSMGSTSSIGQSCSSDLDIWVCHQSWLDSEERQLLQKKCTLLEQWAAAQGAEVSFFLMDESRFRHNESGSLSGEDCGTTQHILLLDEFYRTAVRMAGKRILWNMVPVEEESHYDEYVLSLYSQGALAPNEWMDLGGLSTLSAEEYFGASLWQLYKSIDSPYKAVLKTLLLEAYSWEYPDTSLLSTEIKKRLHDGEIVSFGLDPYCMMLDRVTHYLTAINDPTRLDLARRCFYLKVCEKLSREQACVGWRRQILSQLVQEWGWSDEHLAMLDNRANWKIEQVREAHNELLDAMMQTYRNLIRFARRNNLSVSASPQDIGVLTRKLYAAFEALPGKVTLLNPQISPDLSEPNLTFIYVPPGRANRSGWYLYNQAPSMDAIISHQPLEYNRYLNKLVAWAYFNGLLTPSTRLYIKGNELCDITRLQALVDDVASHFPLRLPAPTPKALYSPCEIRHLAIIVNLEHDPTAAFRNQVVHFDFRHLDVFSFGQQQQCLVGSIDLLYRNSWNEVRTLHFSGEQAVLEALKTILGKMHQDAALPESLEVFCYSQHLRGLIRTRVQQLVSECIELRLTSTRQEPGRFKAVKVAGQTWGLFFERLSVSVQKLENAVEFYGAISNNKLQGQPVQVETNHVHLPPVVDGVASEGIIQFFFEDLTENQGFNIYILDESNRVEVYHHCEGSKEELVRDVSRFYSSSHDRFTYGSSFINFNLPQFYQIVQLDGRTQVIPFRSSALSHLCITPVVDDEVMTMKQRLQIL
ncbi:class I adenylate cyclase [Pectobacterium aroidearum]|uniref:Adenylate cyclase n=2 Tax=Pectobacterium TaxID=122277 RepID=A0AAW3SUE1_9GAMM|nr:MULTISPECIES: class I adenylate cyclase [Pectobacterium]ACT14994.1 putative adenylate cyclase [Pectobacterium carotovorum subsp. carotovorum PC1]MBA0206649.1 class I adenylate cyclase [Pectobacterium aroidearum]MBA5201722.1 class I adenylate cyclase [Pectobacterium aroidearum]MBA5204216.1 class I adenylate cyclase [Pectobacterium aroidearum]MBA5230011.1 class I adenylate cyclase [Pectobacterium aroidearum]